MSEGNPLERTSGAASEPHIPGFDLGDSYSKKVEKHFADENKLEALIEQDENIEKTLKVAPEKGLTPQMAAKIMRDTIERLAANKQKLKELRGGRGMTKQ